MDQEYEKIELNTSYYAIQKLINNNWTTKSKANNLEDAKVKLKEMADYEAKHLKTFQLRVIKTEEILLFKNKTYAEISTDNVTDFF